MSWWLALIFEILERLILQHGSSQLWKNSSEKRNQTTGNALISYHLGLFGVGHVFGYPMVNQQNPKNMSVIDLYENGVINYLLKNGMVSPSISSYIEYFIKFSTYRKSGKTYRESVALLSEEYRVSTTTIKKGIRLVKEAIN